MTKKFNKSPTQLYPHFDGFCGIPPKLFQCVAFNHTHANQRTKIDPWALKYRLIILIERKVQVLLSTFRKFFVPMDMTLIENQPDHS